MKFWLTVLLLLSFSMAWSQVDPSTPQSDDAEFNVFLFTLLLVFIAIIVGAIIAGALLAIISLFALLALVSAGVLSTSILVGLYRKSLAAGFKTAIVLTCSLGSAFLGTIIFWLINRIFQIHLNPPTAALIGAFSGLLGGILLGLILNSIIRLFLKYCRQKLSF
ncbi:MAG: hypothetical protein JST68_26795 [Bacteroidetes bacterium]|nr:hypothetical protein [Bacteroidota bacterium]